MRKKGVGKFVLGGIVGIVLLIPLATMWTDRNLEFWASRIKGEPVDIPYWLSLVVTVVLNVIALAGNSISEVLKYFI